MFRPQQLTVLRNQIKQNEGLTTRCGEKPNTEQQVCHGEMKTVVFAGQQARRTGRYHLKPDLPDVSESRVFKGRDGCLVAGGTGWYAGALAVQVLTEVWVGHLLVRQDKQLQPRISQQKGPLPPERVPVFRFQSHLGPLVLGTGRCYFGSGCS